MDNAYDVKDDQIVKLKGDNTIAAPPKKPRRTSSSRMSDLRLHKDKLNGGNDAPIT